MTLTRRPPSPRQPWEALYEWEQVFHGGDSLVAGVDEVGRGPLAGPVLAAAVILPDGARIPGVNDSKRLSAATRERLAEEICRVAVAVGVGVVGPRTIDAINILQATRLAMKRAMAQIPVPAVCLSDAVIVEGPWQAVAVVGGDARSASIAASSIVAKVVRDRYMAALDRQYPGYDFSGNKGYATRRHFEAIRNQGLCPAHRHSFTDHLEVSTPGITG